MAASVDKRPGRIPWRLDAKERAGPKARPLDPTGLLAEASLT
jgi:hypothetical protein